MESKASRRVSKDAVPLAPCSMARQHVIRGWRPKVETLLKFYRTISDSECSVILSKLNNEKFFEIALIFTRARFLVALVDWRNGTLMVRFLKFSTFYKIWPKSYQRVEKKTVVVWSPGLPIYRYITDLHDTWCQLNIDFEVASYSRY